MATSRSALTIAGAPPATIFLPEAADAVYRYSRGIPRVMNMLCEHALIQAYLEQTRPVGARVIENVARQLQLDEGRPAETMAAPFMASGTSRETLIEADSAVPVLTLTSQSAAATSISCTTEEALLADIANEAEPVWLSETIAAQHDGSRQGLRIVSSPSRASNVTEISRDNRKTEAGSARAESGGPKRESGSEKQRRRIAPASRTQIAGKRVRRFGGFAGILWRRAATSFGAPAGNYGGIVPLVIVALAVLPPVAISLGRAMRGTISLRCSGKEMWTRCCAGCRSRCPQ